MKHYIDITVLPDPEFTETTLMNALYAKCHRALGQLADGEIGVSFPKHKKTLGAQLRLHGAAEKLSLFMEHKWLKGLSDYTEVSTAQEIPVAVEYRTVEQVRKKSPFNKRKRSIIKGWLTAEEAEEKIIDTGDHLLNLPFAQLTSLSNRNQYKVFVRHGELKAEPVTGSFSSYGLSKVATVPWF